MECANCGGQVPADGRFCPYCGSPQPPAVDGETEAVEPRGKRLERLAFGALLVLTAAIVVLAMLVFVFGFWVEESTGSA